MKPRPKPSGSPELLEHPFMSPTPQVLSACSVNSLMNSISWLKATILPVFGFREAVHRCPAFRMQSKSRQVSPA